MSFITFIVSNAILIYVYALLMRVWMQWVRCDYYNPFAQAIVRITQPVVKPLRRIVPSLGPIDMATLLVALILTTIKLPLLLLIGSSTPVSSFSIGFYFLMGFAGLLKAIGNLIFWVLIIRAIMSWISQGRGTIDYLLYQLTDPLMAPIRRIIPPFGGIDFSIMALLFALTGLNYLGYDIMGGLWGLL